MERFFNEPFENLVNSISNHISHKILNLYNAQNEGFNLTNTANEINEKISTTQDHLNKLLKQRLVYRKEKDYFLSNFGEYLFAILKKLSLFGKFKDLFGRIPQGVIPPQFLEKLIPELEKSSIITTSWNFMNTMDKYIKKMKKNLKKSHQNLGIIGWWSLEYDFELMEMYFPDFNLNKNKLKEFFQNFSMKMVTHKGMIQEIKNNSLFSKIIMEDDLIKNFRIYEGVNQFNFCIMRFNQVIAFFLVNDNDIDFQHNIFMENNEKVIETFRELLNYYWVRSTPLKEFF